MSHSRTQHRRGAGFTLIELVLVTAILAVIGAIAAPRYATSLHRYRADAAGRLIAAELLRARAHARQTSSAVRVQFDPARHRLLMPDMPGPDGNPAVIWLDRNPYHARLVEVDFNDSLELSFDGHGQPAHGGTIILRSGQTFRTVTVHPISGQARVTP